MPGLLACLAHLLPPLLPKLYALLLISFSNFSNFFFRLVFQLAMLP
jgi:hypothetical protein